MTLKYRKNYLSIIINMLTFMGIRTGQDSFQFQAWHRVVLGSECVHTDTNTSHSPGSPCSSIALTVSEQPNVQRYRKSRDGCKSSPWHGWSLPSEEAVADTLESNATMTGRASPGILNFLFGLKCPILYYGTICKNLSPLFRTIEFYYATTRTV